MKEQSKKGIKKNLVYTMIPRQDGSLSNTYTKDETDKKFTDASQKLTDANEKLVEAIKRIEKIDLLLFAVVIILLVMVATLVIDSFHINSATYREYSEKINTLDSLNGNNAHLMEQNNKNQELILKQQNQILELLKK